MKYLMKIEACFGLKSVISWNNTQPTSQNSVKYVWERKKNDEKCQWADINK